MPLHLKYDFTINENKTKYMEITPRGNVNIRPTGWKLRL